MSHPAAHLVDAPVAPVAPIVQPLGIMAAEDALDLVPIPGATMGSHGDAGSLFVDRANRAFREAGLIERVLNDADAADLRERMFGFLTSDQPSDNFTWSSGGPVEQRRFRVTLARLLHREEPRVLITLVDRTSEMRTEANLRREMTSDSLTGLPNRAGFGDQLEAMIASGGKQFAVLMVDIDRFSRFNACLGSMAGDELLITVARRIRGALRASDVLARVGGDEFAILVAINDSPSEADHVTQRIRGALAVPFRLSEFDIHVSCAIGMAFGSDAIGDAENVIRHAQFAMKRGKASGRAEVYQPQAFDMARDRFAMETALRLAIEARALTLFYQPICDLATGRIVSFEALARWIGTDGSETPPNDFIPVAEESGLILPLGRWAIDEAVGQLAAWDHASGGACGVRVAVNLSPIQLQRDTVCEMVERALARHGVAGERLTLEVTESALISEPDRIAGVLRALKATGATIAMDDFGTGYSSLAYLQKLPIDLLKIDRSFVTGMLADRDKLAIVRAVLGLAQALGMETVAEGIESHETARMLAALGCTYGQGFNYSRPLNAERAYALLLERNA